jgi:TPR repeat protein
MNRAYEAPTVLETTSAPRSNMRALRVPVLSTLVIAALSLAPQIQANARLFASFWIASAALLAWTLLLGMTAARAGRVLRYDVVLRRQHYVQACMQLSIYLYWGWHWREVYAHAPHIAAQLAFAFGFDSLLSWSRRERWTLGFGPTPIIFSTNLFLWFRDDWFLLQFLMIAVGVAGKELVTWNKDGRRAHIFNPSALSLWLFSAGLLLAGGTAQTWGKEIATTLVYPEHIYLLIFLVGLVVQYLFHVTLTTLGAAAMLLALNLAYTAVTGVYYFVDSAIPIAVFLGLHLLVTDPSTSPRTDLGRLIFGALYGAGVFALYGLLELLGQPTFYDKLLCVPILNLCVRALDRWTGSSWLDRYAGAPFGVTLDAHRRNLLYMTAWIGIFAAAYSRGILDKHHPGARRAFWEQACANDLRNGCRGLSVLESDACSAGSAQSCDDLGVLLMEKAQTPAARAEAGRAFLRACDLGADAGCANFAIHQLFHDPNGTLPASLSERLDRGCASNDGRACYLEGFALEVGRGPARDPASALEHYLRGCAAHWTDACSAAGKLALRGDAGAPDPVGAAASFRSACDDAEPKSCVQLALLYKSGRVPAPAQPRPEDLLQRACDLGLADACRAIESIGH